MSKKKTTTLPLKDYPIDVRRYVLKVQGEAKAEKGISQYSLCKTIYKIIREHKDFMKDRQKISSL